MAVLALFWIIVWIIWTGLLIIFWWNSTDEQTLTEEQYLELQEYLNSLSGTTTPEWEIDTTTQEEATQSGTTTLTWTTN